MAGDSNIDDVGKWLDATIEEFGFQSETGSGPLGRVAARLVAEDIADSAVTVNASADGTEFPDNEAKYAAYKAKRYGRTGKSYGLRTGQMLSVESLMGSVAVSTDSVKMEYGTGKPPSASKTGYLTEADTSITDIEKAWFMTRGGGKAIDFYQLGPHAEAEIAEASADALERHLRRKAGS